MACCAFCKAVVIGLLGVCYRFAKACCHTVLFNVFSIMVAVPRWIEVAQFKLGSELGLNGFRLGKVAAGNRQGSVRVWRNFSTAATE